MVRYWIDESGRILIIERKNSEHRVTVKPNMGAKPYRQSDLHHPFKRTENLMSEWVKNSTSHCFLRVEAGTEGLGPTYDLYFRIQDELTKLIRFAHAADPMEAVFIEPVVSMGLYDDFEDDFGVPWAFPIQKYYKILG